MKKIVKEDVEITEELLDSISEEGIEDTESDIISEEAMAPTNPALMFDDKKVALIKKTIAVGATDDELQLFLYQAQRTRLDPLTRQIYFVKRGDKATIQPSIDGFRLIAQRSGVYAGQDEPVFEEKDGKLVKCSVAVYKFSPSGERYKSSVGVAYWDEYVPRPGQDFMWKQFRHTMLAKVAESLALRQSFPQELSGLYTMEEMTQDMEEIKNSHHNDTEEIKYETDPEYAEHENEERQRKGFIQGLEDDEELEERKKIENMCPQCGKHLVQRHGQYGDFMGCSGYPTCKFILKNK